MTEVCLDGVGAERRGGRRVFILEPSTLPVLHLCWSQSWPSFTAFSLKTSVNPQLGVSSPSSPGFAEDLIGHLGSFCVPLDWN